MHVYVNNFMSNSVKPTENITDLAELRETFKTMITKTTIIRGKRK